MLSLSRSQHLKISRHLRSEQWKINCYFADGNVTSYCSKKNREPKQTNNYHSHSLSLACSVHQPVEKTFEKKKKHFTQHLSQNQHSVFVHLFLTHRAKESGALIFGLERKSQRDCLMRLSPCVPERAYHHRTDLWSRSVSLTHTHTHGAPCHGNELSLIMIIILLPGRTVSGLRAFGLGR